jgi:hypothetical protein
MVDSLSRMDWDCTKGVSHLRECGWATVSSETCSGSKDGTSHPVLTSDQSECIKRLDCNTMRAQAAGGMVCGARVKPY